VQAHRTYWL